MGDTGNSNTYPYGIQYARRRGEGLDQVFNRVTGKVVAEFRAFGIEATQKLNQLVAEYQNATASQKAAIIAPTAQAHTPVA